MRVAKVLLAGFGNVGRSFVEHLLDVGGSVEERYGVRMVIVGIVDSRGAALRREGFSEEDLRGLLNVPRGGVSSIKAYGAPGAGAEDALEEAKPDILVDATPSDYRTGEPGLSTAFAALERGVSLVLANKSPVALRYGEVMDAAKKGGAEVYYRATVMAGTPLIDMLRWGLYGQEPEKVEGVLNGTANYILNLVFDEDLGVREALKRAQEEGYAEPDPSLDVDGWDAAAKAAIIASTLGQEMTVHDVKRRSLTSLSQSEIEEARRKKARLRYVAVVDLVAGETCVDVMPIERPSPLFTLPGPLNAAILKLRIGSSVCIAGPGAGRKVTAAALLSDVVVAALGGRL